MCRLGRMPGVLTVPLKAASLSSYFRAAPLSSQAGVRCTSASTRTFNYRSPSPGVSVITLPPLSNSPKLVGICHPLLSPLQVSLFPGTLFYPLAAITQGSWEEDEIVCVQSNVSKEREKSQPTERQTQTPLALVGGER